MIPFTSHNYHPKECFLGAQQQVAGMGDYKRLVKTGSFSQLMVFAGRLYIHLAHSSIQFNPQRFDRGVIAHTYSVFVRIRSDKVFAAHGIIGNMVIVCTVINR